MKYKVGIIGCGSIFIRHLNSIKRNKNFELSAICDIQEDLVKKISEDLSVRYYTDYKEMIVNEDINFVTILTPNSQHIEQSLFSLKNGCDILVEKPVSFNHFDIENIKTEALKNNRNAYCVLQVRLNPTIKLIQKVLDLKLLGDIRGISLIQRWQRPIEYFSGWRAEPSIGGGTLYEVGIHYLDILQKFFGVPNVVSSKVYKTKHKSSKIEDTIYCIFDFGSFGGTCEVNISSEPHNLECSLSILGSNGFLKIGGKAMNIIESHNFLSHGATKKFEDIMSDFNQNKPNEPNSYDSYFGSCPNHPELYTKLIDFDIMESYNAIKLINEIYEKSGIKYE
jgi:UDP-N-acetyl-2-amino-2-deoxyglucuronate dehydrogenase